MAKFTVDEFIVQLGFNESVIKGLQRIEKLAMASAKRIESRFSKVLTLDTKQPTNAFSSILKNANTTATNINKAFAKSINFGNAGKSALKTVEGEAKASAKRIRKELQGAFKITATVDVKLGRAVRRKVAKAAEGESQDDTKKPVKRRKTLVDTARDKYFRAIERAADSSAARIQAKYRNVTNIDIKQPLSAITRVMTSADSAASAIKRVFHNSLNFDNAGRASLKGFEAEAKAAARRLHEQLVAALRVRGDIDINLRRRNGSGGSGGGNPPPVPPRGGGGGGSAGAAARSIERTHSNNYYSGLTRRLESMGERGQGLAANFRTRINGLRDEALRNPSQNLANFNMNMKQTIDSMKRWISAENSEIKARQKQTWLLDRANNSMNQWIGGFASLYTAIAGIKKMIEVGIARQGANISADSVFKGDSKNAKTFAANFAQDIGQGYSETLKQYTSFAAGAQTSMGYQGSQDFYKNAAMFGRIRGLDSEQMKGIMVAFTQMASKGQIQAEELRGQLGDRLPGSEQTVADALGLDLPSLNNMMKNGKLLAKDVLPKVNKEFAKIVQASGGLEKIQSMAVTQMGKVGYAWENDLNKAFVGSEKGIGVFSAALFNLLNDSGDIAEALGGIFGKFVEIAGRGLDYVDYFARQVDALLLRTEAWYMELDDGQKKLVQGAVDFGVAVAETLIVLRALKAVATGIAAISGLGGLLSGGGAAAGAGAAGGLLAKASGFAKKIPVIGAATAIGMGAGDYYAESSEAYGKRHYGDETTAGGNIRKSSWMGKAWDNYIAPTGAWLQGNNALKDVDAKSPFDIPDSESQGLGNHLDMMNDWFDQHKMILDNPTQGFNPQSLFSQQPQPVQNNQRLNINFNVDGRKMAGFSTDLITHNNEDVNINTEHLED